MTTHVDYYFRDLTTRSADSLASLIGKINNWIAYQQLKRQIEAERRQLLSLSQTALNDIGISRHQAEIEARRHDIPVDRRINIC